jgi:hypothetical protein
MVSEALLDIVEQVTGYRPTPEMVAHIERENAFAPPIPAGSLDRIAAVMGPAYREVLARHASSRSGGADAT